VVMIVAGSDEVGWSGSPPPVCMGTQGYKNSENVCKI